jgi:hypothetical protein
MTMRTLCLLLLTAALSSAQTNPVRPVQHTNGRVVSPTNFWAANSNALNAVVVGGTNGGAPITNALTYATNSTNNPVTGPANTNPLSFSNPMNLPAGATNNLALQFGTNPLGTGLFSTATGSALAVVVTNNTVAALNNSAFSIYRPLAFVSNSTNWSVEQLQATSRAALGLTNLWLTNPDTPIFSTATSIVLGAYGTNVASLAANTLVAAHGYDGVSSSGGSLRFETYQGTSYSTTLQFPQGSPTNYSISIPEGNGTLAVLGIGYLGTNAPTTLTNLFTNGTGLPAFGAASNSVYTVVGGQGAWVAPRSVTKVRTNDFVRTNSSITYSNDDTLAGWTLDASSLYSVTLWIPYTCSTNSAFKGQITVPAMERADQNFGSIVVESGGQVFSIGSSNTIIPLAARTTASAAKNWVGRLFFRTGTNSGTANFQWAPAAGGSGTNTNTTTLHSGATITFTKISD